MAANASAVYDLPPLPTYTLSPRPPLWDPIPDSMVSLILPIVAYWGLSMVYHYIDTMDLFPQYRLHTPAEVLKRNHVSRWDVVRDVVLQQIIQTIAGIAMGYFDPPEYIGKEEYDVAVWARRFRLLQRGLPRLLTLFGVDALGLSKKLALNGHTVLGGILAGGRYPGLTQTMILENGAENVVPAFAAWELAAGSFIYWYFIPALQFAWGVCVVDTWQYFLHRAMHLNRWLYGKCFEFSPLPWILRADNAGSHISLASPPPLCSVCVRCSLQSPCRGFPARHSRYRRGVPDGSNDKPPSHVVLHLLHHQDCR